MRFIMTPCVRQSIKKGSGILFINTTRNRERRVLDFYPALIFDASESLFVP